MITKKEFGHILRGQGSKYIRGLVLYLYIQEEIIDLILAKPAEEIERAAWNAFRWKFKIKEDKNKDDSRI